MSAANLLRSAGNGIHAQPHIYLRHRTLINLHRRIGDDGGLILTAMTALILRVTETLTCRAENNLFFPVCLFSNRIELKNGWLHVRRVVEVKSGRNWSFLSLSSFLRCFFVRQRREWREAEIHFFSRHAAVDLTLIYVLFFDCAWKKSR